MPQAKFDPFNVLCELEPGNKEHFEATLRQTIDGLFVSLDTDEGVPYIAPASCRALSKWLAEAADFMEPKPESGTIEQQAESGPQPKGAEIWAATVIALASSGHPMAMDAPRMAQIADDIRLAYLWRFDCDNASRQKETSKWTM